VTGIADWGWDEELEDERVDIWINSTVFWKPIPANG
jgi:hypothetical protein